jgi:anti-sigma factor ChrR (cupin superfamily)
MKLNHDLSKRIVVHSEALPWQPSPADGVHRRLLARDGEENTQATSIVRYTPGAVFPTHAHPGGEESWHLTQKSARIKPCTAKPERVYDFR